MNRVASRGAKMLRVAAAVRDGSMFCSGSSGWNGAEEQIGRSGGRYAGEVYQPLTAGVEARDGIATAAIHQNLAFRGEWSVK
jgi:hypothetical protein